MGPAYAFIDPQTRLVRSGWRLLVFVVLSPQLILSLVIQLWQIGQPGQVGQTQNGTAVGGNLSTFLGYAISIAWTIAVSWLCLHFLDRLKLASLGFAFHRGWWRDVLSGASIGALMVAFIVGLQSIGGGTQVKPNPIWSRSGSIDRTGMLTVAGEVSAALLLFILAGVLEELIYRGYPFQTLLRGTPIFFPVLLFGLLFGIGHLGNPNRTFFSTVNTVLAGVWLSSAYLKTRNLWFPTSLHFSWNWTMGAFFGLPVSGLVIPRNPILLSTSEGPSWLTGGSYGCEGGAAATVVVLITIVLLWRTKWRSGPADSP